MSEIDTDPAALIDALVAFDDIKVWSMLVTILGDRTADPGLSVPGPVLSVMTRRMGIKPEAQRVALHRLRKDNWLETSKRGRVSHYSLSAAGRAETIAVQNRVFGRLKDLPTTCSLIAFQSKAALKAAQDAHPIGPQIALAEVGWTGSSAAITAPIDLRDLPDWARSALVPDTVTQTYENLHALLTQHNPSPGDFSEDDAQVFRVLVLHWWRKLVLGHSETAAQFMPPDWAGHACRQRIYQLLRDFPKASS